MSKISKIALSGLIISVLVIGCYLSYKKGFNDGVVDKKLGSEIITKIDYLLIDIYFDKNDSWLLINCDNLLGENENFETISNPEVLEFYKEYLAVKTFPVGRGTTPKGKVFIFKNGKMFREVQYLEIDIDGNLKKEFKKVKKIDVIDLIKDYLL